MIRENLNKNWVLQHGLSTFMENIFGNPAPAEIVDLPNDVMITLGRDAAEITGAGMGYFKGENVEYTREFYVSSEEKEKVHYLKFEGVYMNTTFLVNGLYVTKHENGYTPCLMQIDRYLKYGSINKITVMIRGSAQPFARWYSGLGIYRNVYLLTGEYLHIAEDGVRITTLDCDENLAIVEVEAEVLNMGAMARQAKMNLCVRQMDGAAVSNTTVRFYVDANNKVLVRKRITLDNPQLWDCDTPNLYSCTCSIVDGDKEVDCTEASFGIRKLQLDSRNGLRVNGKSVKLRGGCVHHDNGVIGAVSIKDAELRKVRLMKEGGYNAIRTAHNPPSPELLEACDQVGMFVMHEFTDVWTDVKAVYDYGQYMAVCWENDLENVIRRDYNHPSIIIWSIGNENPETGNPVSLQWGRKMTEKIRQLDHSRYITNGLNVMVSVMPRMAEVLNAMIIHDGGTKEDAVVSGGVNEIMDTHPELLSKLGAGTFLDRYVEEACDILDIVGYNYTSNRYEREHEMYPDWVFVGTETNSPELDMNWDVVKRNPYVIGDFAWTGWDYLGEVGCGRLVEKEKKERASMAPYPWLLANCADFDVTGFRRPMSYWREIIWNGRRHEPYIAVHNPERYGKEFAPNNHAWTDSLNSWSWPGKEGHLTVVEVYSDAEEVELFVNGKTLGKKPVGDAFKKFYCKWITKYEPGEVLAIAYINGEEVGRNRLKTVGKANLQVRADKIRLKAGSDDLCFVEIELRDEDGTLDMASKRTAFIQTEGPVTVLGSGSGDPMSEESYQAMEHLLFEGRMLAVIKAQEKTGMAKFTVSSDGMDDVVIELAVV